MILIDSNVACASGEKGSCYFPPRADTVAAGKAWHMYAIRSCGSEGEMLTVWQAPELARGPLSPPFCLCLLKRRKCTITSTKAESFNFSLSPRELNCLIIAAAGRCHPCFSAAGMTVCQNDVDRGQFLGSFMAPDSGAQHQIQEVLQRCVSKTSKSRKEER